MSEVSYAVRQFFANGGRDAIIVRIAKGRRPVKKRLVEGIHALDDEDLFNVLCLPGVADPVVYADAIAYCRTRRAFFIADAPAAIVKPDDMDSAHGVRNAPAGKGFTLAEVSGPAYALTDAENGKLN